MLEPQHNHQSHSPERPGIAAVAAVGLVVSPKYRELQSCEWREREEKQLFLGSTVMKPG